MTGRVPYELSQPQSFGTKQETHSEHEPKTSRGETALRLVFSHHSLVSTPPERTLSALSPATPILHRP